MARLSPASADTARLKAEGTLSAVAAGDWVPISSGVSTAFNFWISGTFVATYQIEASFDGGVTSVPVRHDSSGFVTTFTTQQKGFLVETESNVLYRVRCTAYTSGTIAWRFSF